MTVMEFPGPGFTADQWEQIKTLAVSMKPGQGLWISGYFAGLDHAARRLGPGEDHAPLPLTVGQAPLAAQQRALAIARPFAFTSNGDRLGWQRGEDDRVHCTLFIENGRVINRAGQPMMDGLREIARIHEGTFRITPNQNLVIADIAPAARPRIEALMKAFGLDALNRGSGLRVNAMACVALPTCGLAMAESERYLPDLVGKIDAILARLGLSEEPITIRMMGCPNGCARPYIAEIGLTGRAPGKYNLYLGGGFSGQCLNRMVLENVAEGAILGLLEDVLTRYAADRLPGERFGDFAIRAGYVAEVREGRAFND